MKLLISFLLLLPFIVNAQTQKPPNVILIFMDDMGYGDMSAYGALQYQTPNLDRLAADGVRFTNFVTAQPVCSASRAALLTGCYPNRIGISGALFPDSKIGLNPKETTISEMMKTAGYVTSMIGKWHLGVQKEFLPVQHGFDSYFGLPYSNDMWPVGYDGKAVRKDQPQYRFPPLPLIRDDKPVEIINNLEKQGNLTARYTEEAVSFIKKNQFNTFFLYLAHSMPHVPIAASSKFKGRSRQGAYGDVMMEIDWSVGEILKTLTELWLEKNTIVIFTSDNGPWLKFGNHAGSSGGFREGKGTSFEGGHRVPCIVRWTDRFPAGVVTNKLSSTLDILPTLAAVCSLKMPTTKIDGVNILPLMEGKDATPRKHFFYYYDKNNLKAVRRDNWKLVLPHQSQLYETQLQGSDGFPGITTGDNPIPLALYDLRRDPSERYDVQKLYPEIVSELKRLAEMAREDLGDDLTKRAGKNNRQPGVAK